MHVLSVCRMQLAVQVAPRQRAEQARRLLRRLAGTRRAALRRSGTTRVQLPGSAVPALDRPDTPAARSRVRQRGTIDRVAARADGWRRGERSRCVRSEDGQVCRARLRSSPALVESALPQSAAVASWALALPSRAECGGCPKRAHSARRRAVRRKLFRSTSRSFCWRPASGSGTLEEQPKYRTICCFCPDCFVFSSCCFFFFLLPASSPLACLSMSLLLSMALFGLGPRFCFCWCCPFGLLLVCAALTGC